MSQNIPIHKNNFFIFTGGPGAGKTTVLEQLQQQGYLIVPEVARAIIKEQNQMNGNITHTGDRMAYRDLMLQHAIRDFIQMSASNKPVFFDRGIPDLYSYSKRFCDDLSVEVLQAIQHYRYNARVIIFPPWSDIYCHDTERKQNFQEAIETYEAIQSGYTECGYTLIEMPKESVENRIKFIMKILSDHNNN